MMHAREQFGGRLLPPRKDGNLMLIALLFYTGVTFPAISMYNATRFYRLLDESFQTVRRGVSDASHPYSSSAFPIFLCRNNYQSLFLRPSSPETFLRGTNVSLVNLDSASQSVSSRADHCTPQFVQPGPSGFVAPQTENSLHCESTGSGLQRGYPPDHPEPHRQRFACTVKNSSSRHGTLVGTTSALNQCPTHTPSFGMSTSRTQVTIGPAQLEKVVQARLFRREPRLQFCKCPGIIFHTREHYM